MRGYLKFGEGGFAFSLEAIISLLACVALISLVSTQSYEDFSDVMVYKQASDFLEVSIADGSIGKHDTAHIKQLLGALGLRAKLVVENETLLDETPEVLATIHRTMVTDHGDYAEITLEVGRQSRSTSF